MLKSLGGVADGGYLRVDVRPPSFRRKPETSGAEVPLMYLASGGMLDAHGLGALNYGRAVESRLLTNFQSICSWLPPLVTL